MSSHQSSAVSVATFHRRQDVREARKAVRLGRRHAWSHTRGRLVGGLVFRVALFAAVFDAAR